MLNIDCFIVECLPRLTLHMRYYIVINTPCNKINQRTLNVRKINQLGPYQNCPKFYERIGFSVLV